MPYTFDLRDEYDGEETADIEIFSESETEINYHVNGKTSILSLEELLNINILDSDEEFNSIGGLFLQKECDSFEIDKISFFVLERDGMSIKTVEIKVPVYNL